MEATLGRACRRVCQNGISDGQKDGRNRGGCFYSDRGWTAGRGAVSCQLKGVGRGGVGEAVTEQWDEDHECRGRGNVRRKDSPNT